jgi:hypothetical protein
MGYIDEGRNLFIRVKDYYSIPHGNGSTYKADIQNEYDINGKVVQSTVFDRSFIYTKSIDLNIYRFPFTNMSILDEFGYKAATYKTSGTNTDYFNYGKQKLIDTVTVNMPADLAALIPDDLVQSSLTTNYYWPTAINKDEGFMYISFIIPTGPSTNGGNLPKNGKIYTWKIDMYTFESTWFTVINTTNNAFSYDRLHYASGTSSKPFILVTNNYTVLFSSPADGTGYVWIINNETGDIKQLVRESDDTVTSLSYNFGCYVYNDLVIVFDYSSTTYIHYRVINLKTGKLGYICSSDSIITKNYSYVVGRTFNTKFPKLVVVARNSGSTIGALFKFYTNPQYLLTINNLSEPVIKTPSQTMKVTYVISRAN